LIQRNVSKTKAELLYSYGIEVFEFPKQSLFFLLENEVQIIRLDQQGNPWVVTRPGIYHKIGANKWDKHLASSSVVADGMEVDQTNRLWLGTSAGVYMIAPEEDEIKIADFQYTPIILDERQNPWYWCGQHQYCSGTGEEKIDLGTKTLLAFDAIGQIWAYESHSTAIDVFNGKEWRATSLGSHTIPYGRFPSAFDNQGNLWVSVYNDDNSNGVCCALAHFDGAQWRFENVPFEVKTTWYASITDIAFDAYDQLWVSASIANTGLAMKENDAWKFFDLSDLTTGTDNVHALFIDKQNQLWVGAGSSLIHIDLKKGDPITEIPAATEISQTIQLLRIVIIFFALLAVVCCVIGLYKSLSFTSD
jgi:hypothetical protein